MLDMRTIFFSKVLTDIVCMLVILLLWHQSRKRFAGTGFWVFGYAFQTAGLFLIILRSSIPDWMSMVLANTLVIAGALLGYIGLGRFVGKKSLQVHNYVLLAAFACVHSYFAFVQPNLAARNLNLSAGLLIICFQCMWLLVHRVEAGMRQVTLGVGLVFGAYCLVNIVRIVEFFIGTHAKSDYFQSGAFGSLILISYQMLLILLTYSLALMFNKRLLVAVKTQEEKFSKAFHSSPYAITLTRLSDGQIIEVNDGFLNITGYQYGEIMGKTTVGLQFWDKEEDRGVAVNELSKSGKVREREFKFRKKSGELITGLFSAEIISINNQEFVLSSLSDITERKRMEEALKESEVRYRLLAENASDTIWTANMNMQATYISPSVTRLLGYTVEEAKSRTVEEAYTPASFETAKRAFAEEMALENARQGDPNRSRILELELTRKDGGVVPVEANFSFLRDAMGKPVGILSIARDITERKRMEEALRHSEEKYRSILEEMEEGYFETDLVGNLTFINDAGCRHLGYPRQELIGMNNRVYADEENAKKVFQAFNEAYKTGQPCRVFDYEITRKDGTKAIIELSASPIRDPEGKPTGFRGVSRNITERKRIEEEREKLIHELQEALANIKTLRGLLAICSHCKKIRDEKGYWNQIESYIQDHSGAEFTHGMCPECMKKLYPDFVD